MVLRGEAQKTLFENKKQKTKNKLPKNIKEKQKIGKEFPFIGAFKVPCTLP